MTPDEIRAEALSLLKDIAPGDLEDLHSSRLPNFAAMPRVIRALLALVEEQQATVTRTFERLVQVTVMKYPVSIHMLLNWADRLKASLTATGATKEHP